VYPIKLLLLLLRLLKDLQSLVYSLISVLMFCVLYFASCIDVKSAEEARAERKAQRDAQSLALREFVQAQRERKVSASNALIINASIFDIDAGPCTEQF
jgi:hypothetical protein